MPKKRSRLWDVSRRMPPLRHSMPGETFDIERSEVVAWLLERPEIMQAVFDRVSGYDCIVYDKRTGTWKGADYGA